MITTETSLKGNTMTTSTELHPWLSTPEATEAARKAIQIPLALLPSLAGRVSTDKLETQALVILTECAMPPRDLPPTECLRCGGSLEDVRKGAKFCSPDCRKQYAVNVQRSRGGSVERPRGGSAATVLPPAAHAHIGSMYSWPESERRQYAVKTVGYALNNWLRTQHRWAEASASELLANMNVPAPETQTL